MDTTQATAAVGQQANAHLLSISKQLLLLLLLLTSCSTAAVKTSDWQLQQGLPKSDMSSESNLSPAALPAAPLQRE
jgi:hypothetical protein